MLRKVGYVYGGSGHKNLSTQTEEGGGCLPAEDGSRGTPFVGEADRPGWLRASPCLGFLPT
jgi:hypothetical protein